MNEEKLITEIHKNESIWNKRNQNYWNKELKAEAWRKVAAEVGDPELLCRKRWKSLRDRFVIEQQQLLRPRVSGARHHKYWPFYEMLLFLSDIVTPKHKALETNAISHEDDSIIQEMDLELMDREERQVLTSTPLTSCPSQSTPIQKTNSRQMLELKLGNILENINELILKSRSEGFLGMLGQICEQIPPDELLNLQIELLNLANERAKSYKK